MLNFVVLTLFPTFVAMRNMIPSLGLAHGACILLGKEAYERTGGHDMVQAELFEDTALARAWRRARERGACVDGQDAVRVRMYDGFVPMWWGFTKNAYPAFRHELSFWLFLALHLAVFTVPFLAVVTAALTGSPWQGWAAAAACTLAMRLLLAARFRHPGWSALLHPVASLTMCSVALFSWFRCRTGEGVVWKGRTYRNERAGHAA
jgi:chlorobactene glucosyltransferase